jgi:molybdate transport system permease protein
MGQRAQHAVFIALGGILVIFLTFPLLCLVLGTSWGEFVTGLSHPLVWPALKLSLMTTVSSLVLVVVFGTPLAWSLANRSGRTVRAIETLLELPIVIPPAVAGVALLLAFGRQGIGARLLHLEGRSVTFTTSAVIMAEVFVSAPFFIKAAISAFRRLDPQLLVVARTFGASTERVFFVIALPLAAPGVVAGASMSWARSLGEFGATLMFAGNLQGETQTLPLAIYTALEADLRAAQALSIVLVAIAFLLLLTVRFGLRGSLVTTDRSS